MRTKRHVSERARSTSPPAVARMIEKARRLEAKGARLTHLLRGEPDFNTPGHICEASIKALQEGETHYPPPQGVSGLRRAVARRMQRDFGIDPDPDREVMVTSGATMGLYIAIQAVIESGDEVLLFDPIYDPYPTIVRAAGGIPIRIPAEAIGGHFSVQSRDIESCISSRTKAILINNPWNPTGSVLRSSELNDLVNLAEDRDLVLISDEIYEMIVFGPHRHLNLASLSTEGYARTITVNSFSKTYAMTGWRLGYNIAPEELTIAMLRVAQQFSRSAATFVQLAGVAALEGPQDCVTSMVDTYARRRELVSAVLSDLGSSVFYPPEGTFFVFVDIRPFGLDSQDMADYLLKQANVVCVPGDAYGPGGEGYIRLSFAYSEATLQRGLTAVVEALGDL